VSDFLDDLLRLWVEPIGDPAASETTADAFRSVYADPVTVNGVPMPVPALVERARALQRAYEGLRAELLDRVETQDRLVVAFVMHGRHTGPLVTPLGTLPPTGREMAARTIDVLQLADGRVHGIWVVSDELGVLTQLDAVRLRSG
jgi:hypothetical protein